MTYADKTLRSGLEMLVHPQHVKQGHYIQV
jgi:hypothetical protein